MRGNSKAGAARRPRRKTVFLQALTETVNVTLACRRAGIPRRTAYDWREQDAAFAGRWDEALEEGIDLLEAELQRRAFEGVERPITYRGEQVGTWRYYSDALAMFLLKAHRPERYRGTLLRPTFAEASAGRQGFEGQAEDKSADESETTDDGKARAYRDMMERIWAENREPSGTAVTAPSYAKASADQMEGGPEPSRAPPPPDWPPEGERGGTGKMENGGAKNQ